MLFDLFVIAYVLIPRLFYFAPEIDSWDAVDFALGLHSFNIEAYQPHFPGYPVFIALAKIFSLLGCSDAVALSLPGLLALCAALVFLRRVLTKKFSSNIGLSTVMLLASVPAVSIFSVRPMSDALGLSCLLVTLGLGLSERWRLTGLSFGLALGVRLSYAPFFLSILLLLSRTQRAKQNTKDFLFGFLGGIALWLIPILFLEGFGSLLSEGLRFVTGHFTRWGGVVDTDTDWLERAQMILWNLWAYGLGGLWPVDGVSLVRALSSCSVIVCLVSLVRTLTEREQRSFFFILFAPYFLWVTLGQNPESPRHMIPVLVLLIGLAAQKTKLSIALLCSALFLSTSMSLLKEQATTPAPQAALARYIKENLPPSARFYGWKTTRLVNYYAPDIEAKLMRSLPKLVEDLKQSPTSAPVLFESKLTERRRRDRCFEVIESFRRTRYLDPAYASITLFKDCGP